MTATNFVRAGTICRPIRECRACRFDGLANAGDLTCRPISSDFNPIEVAFTAYTPDRPLHLEKDSLTSGQFLLRRRRLGSFAPLRQWARKIFDSFGCKPHYRQIYLTEYMRSDPLLLFPGASKMAGSTALFFSACSL